LTADPAASSNDAFNASTFSAAAAASNGLTLAGSALAIAVSVAAGSTIGSVTTLRPDAMTPRLFGIRPRRRLSASTVPSSFV
jgi:hypothetical protein